MWAVQYHMHAGVSAATELWVCFVYHTGNWKLKPNWKLPKSQPLIPRLRAQRLAQLRESSQPLWTGDLIKCVPLNPMMKAGWLRPSGFCGIIINAPYKKTANQPYYWQFPHIPGRAGRRFEDYPGSDKSPGPWQSRLQKNQICLLLIINGMP